MKEKITIRKVLCLVNTMIKGQHGFIKSGDILVFKKDGKYYRCIKLSAKVYEFDGADNDFSIEKIGDRILDGDSYLLEEGWGYALEAVENFRFNAKVFTTPVEIEPQEELPWEDDPEDSAYEDEDDEFDSFEGLQRKIKKIPKEADKIRFLEDLKPNTPEDLLKIGLDYAIDLEDYETCSILQKWIDAKKRDE